MDSRRVSGEASKLRERIILEEIILVDCEVVGAKDLSIRVAKQKASGAAAEQK